MPGTHSSSYKTFSALECTAAQGAASAQGAAIDVCAQGAAIDVSAQGAAIDVSAQGAASAHGAAYDSIPAGSLSGEEEYRLSYKYLIKMALSRCSDKAPSSVYCTCISLYSIYPYPLLQYIIMSCR